MNVCPYRLLAVALLLLLAGTPSLAATWTVNPDGSGDYPTIQAAVDASADGDEILLGNGTFGPGAGNRDVDFGGKAISIRSASGNADVCVIDCGGAGGFRFMSQEGPASELAAITIVDAGSNYGALFCLASSPSIHDVVVLNSRGVNCWGLAAPTLTNVTLRGGRIPAVACAASPAVLVGCLIESNTISGTTRSVGAIHLRASDVTLDGCTIRGNGSTDPSPWGIGGIGVRHSDPVIRNTVITGNRGAIGGGLYVEDASVVTLDHCTIASNEGTQGGGLTLWSLGVSPVVYVRNSIVWGNCGSDGQTAYLPHAGTVLDIDCSDVDPGGIEGPGTVVLGADVLSVDPLFCAPDVCGSGLPIAGVYTLATGSPALTHPCGAMGALGAGCASTSAGALLEARSWGAIKAGYR